MKRILISALLAVSSLAAPLAATAQDMAKPTAAAASSSVASLDPRLKFKDGERYLRDLSQSLNIPREKVCMELGQYDCFTDAFRIVLGGVDAEELGVNAPLEEQALTAPIAIDRLALHVCVTRVKMDVADPANAVLLRNAKKTGAPNAAWKRQTASGLYEAILRRDPTKTETAQLLGFYDNVAKTDGKPNPDATKDWVTLGCFALASSLENVFY